MGMNLATTNPFEMGSTQLVRMGKRYRDQHGRTFHYCEAGSTALAPGKLVVAKAVVANHNNLSFQTAPAIGDTEVKVTLGGTAAVVDLYKDGWLNIQDGTGEGQSYPIEGHPAQTSTTGTLTVTLKEQIRVAGALAQSNVDLILNKYKEVLVEADQAQTDVAVGVPIVTITADYFGWLQTWGPCSVWRDSAEGLGAPLTSGATTGTGQIEDLDTIAQHLVGHGGPAVGVADEYQLCYLQLAP